MNRGSAKVIYQRTIEIPASVRGNVAKLLFGGWVFVWLAVPETKGKTWEEIERFWRP